MALPWGFVIAFVYHADVAQEWMFLDVTDKAAFGG